MFFVVGVAQRRPGPQREVLFVFRSTVCSGLAAVFCWRFAEIGQRRFQTHFTGARFWSRNAVSLRNLHHFRGRTFRGDAEPAQRRARCARDRWRRHSAATFTAEQTRLRVEEDGGGVVELKDFRMLPRPRVRTLGSGVSPRVVL